MMEVLLVLGQSTSPPPTYTFADTGMIWCLVYILISAQDPPWIHHLAGVIQIMLLVILHFVLLMVMVKVM